MNLRRTSRRALKARIAELETANARLTDQLRVSLAISEHYLRQEIADDLAKRVAEGPVSSFEQSMRSLYVYGAAVQTPPFKWPTIGGSGV